MPPLTAFSDFFDMMLLSPSSFHLYFQSRFSLAASSEYFSAAFDAAIWMFTATPPAEGGQLRAVTLPPDYAIAGLQFSPPIFNASRRQPLHTYGLSLIIIFGCRTATDTPL